MEQFQEEKWTQDEAIAYECAREAISEVMAICTHCISVESRKEIPDVNRLAALQTERSRLSRERSQFHVHDHADIARVRATYGAIVRTWHKEHHFMGQAWR